MVVVVVFFLGGGGGGGVVLQAVICFNVYPHSALIQAIFLSSFPGRRYCKAP